MDSTKTYKRALVGSILERIRAERGFLQVVAGPRQVGKTHALRQALQEYGGSSRYVPAGGRGAGTREWLESEWNRARLAARRTGSHLLAIDEIQKVDGWSGTVKRLWDEDTSDGTPLKVVLLGPSRLLDRKGLSASLAGRFELIQAGHWTYAEMRDAFGFSLEDYILFGGYPGAAPLRRNETRWDACIRDSIAGPSISRDILRPERIEKPELLLQFFLLACQRSARILSYRKMLGQLQTAGSAATLARYLRLLGEAGLVRGLGKHPEKAVRSKASSPKLVVCNTALFTAFSLHPLEMLRSASGLSGRLVESAAGAHLLATAGDGIGITYWNDGAKEVDYIVSDGERTAAFAIKSSRDDKVSGLNAFKRIHPGTRCYLVGGQGMDLETFFSTPAGDFLGGGGALRAQVRMTDDK